ncbi:MAG TPA: hypothetical protein VKZ84_04855 [Bacteriovoracaceae bacterium]|nr:hypothetical protein [Bacteriovoracaceae bacterium]
MRLKSYAAKTHQGPYLQVNEDGYEFDFENDLYFIFDAFGGSGVGDTAGENFKHNLKSFYTKLADDPNATMPLYYNPRNLLEGNALINALLNAHQSLLTTNSLKTINQRAGISTVIGVKADSLMVLVGIGNCCAYHFREGNLTKVIQEDDMKFLSKGPMEGKFRSTPLNALGMYPELTYNLKEVRIIGGDKLLLLTDGIFGTVSEEEILYHLSRPALDSGERLNSLLKLSNSKGNVDNQAAMLLEY